MEEFILCYLLFKSYFDLIVSLFSRNSEFSLILSWFYQVIIDMCIFLFFRSSWMFGRG